MYGTTALIRPQFATRLHLNISHKTTETEACSTPSSPLGVRYSGFSLRIHYCIAPESGQVSTLANRYRFDFTITRDTPVTAQEVAGRTCITGWGLGLGQLPDFYHFSAITGSCQLLPF